MPAIVVHLAPDQCHREAAAWRESLEDVFHCALVKVEQGHSQSVSMDVFHAKSCGTPRYSLIASHVAKHASCIVAPIHVRMLPARVTVVDNEELERYKSSEEAEMRETLD